MSRFSGGRENIKKRSKYGGLKKGFRAHFTRT